jgi:hypothetical protein
MRRAASTVLADFGRLLDSLRQLRFKRCFISNVIL